MSSIFGGKTRDRIVGLRDPLTTSRNGVEFPALFPWIVGNPNSPVGIEDFRPTGLRFLGSSKSRAPSLFERTQSGKTLLDIQAGPQVLALGPIGFPLIKNKTKFFERTFPDDSELVARLNQARPTVVAPDPRRSDPDLFNQVVSLLSTKPAPTVSPDKESSK